MGLRTLLLILILFLAGCDGISGSGTQLTVDNQRTVSTAVHVAFGANSKITADSWDFCKGSGLTCSFSLAAKSSKKLPNPSGALINATFSFDAPVECGVTKAEININNPHWYDVLDVSLVDGYSNRIQITVTPTDGESVLLGPPVTATGNEKVFGLFPYGCDICVERQNPPCGITPGKTGCKSGGQYSPAVPCQWQGPTKSGGGQATITLLP